MTSASRHSIDSGDVVLCNLPPYSTQPWLSMGVVLHAALLGEAGIRARVVRPIDPPFGVPEQVLDASLKTLCFDPSMHERLDAMEDAYRVVPDFFDRIVDELLAGGEDVVALSVFRNNVDVTLQVAKLLKSRRPTLLVVVGGPEAVEAPSELLLPFVDAVVGIEAECVIVSLMRMLLDGRVDRAARLRSVWVHGADSPMARERSPTPGLPTIDYAPFMRLFVGDPEPTVPLLFNWGCPYACSYCSNRTIYARFTEGSSDRLLREMDSALFEWQRLHDRRAPSISLQLSDATTNALPRQFDSLLEQVKNRIPTWGMRPSLRGQTLFDARITTERLRLWRDAGFEGTFFGLDVIDDSQRRALNRPGSLAQVRDAVRRYIESGLSGLGVGIPIGVPGETDEHFERTLEFVDWVLSLDEKVQSFTALPFVFFQSAQDAEFVRQNQGPPRGVLWRSDTPGGDPAERARRFMRLYDHVDGRVPTISPIPPYLILPAMLPDEDPVRLEAWMERHGRIFDQIEPGDVRARPPCLEPEGVWARALEALQQEVAPWAFETFEHDRGRLTVVFRHVDGESRLAMQLEARDPGLPSFARTASFNVSYLQSWQGLPCRFDEAWLRRRIDDVCRAERAD